MKPTGSIAKGLAAYLNSLGREESLSCNGLQYLHIRNALHNMHTLMHRAIIDRVSTASGQPDDVVRFQVRAT